MPGAADCRRLGLEADPHVAGKPRRRARRPRSEESDTIQAGDTAGWGHHAPNNVAKSSLIPDSVISRTRLRPRYGQGWQPQLATRPRQADGRSPGEEESS